MQKEERWTRENVYALLVTKLYSLSFNFSPSLILQSYHSRTIFLNDSGFNKLETTREDLSSLTLKVDQKAALMCCNKIQEPIPDMKFSLCRGIPCHYLHKELRASMVRKALSKEDDDKQLGDHL